jgi:RNA recognition motif-containing protein
MATATISSTLYVNRLSEKTPVSELKRTLFTLFSPYGSILEICAHRGQKRRGQAWITFQEIDSAVRAKNSLDRYYLFDRPICVTFSSHKSLVTTKLSGSFNPYGRRAETLTALEAEGLAKGAIPRWFDYEMESCSEEEPVVIPAIQSQREVQAPVNEMIPPNKTLFVQHLPLDTDTSLLLDMLFRQYRGYLECRLAPMHPEIAFVEFGTVEQATAAMSALNGFAIDETTNMLIQYARGGTG